MSGERARSVPPSRSRGGLAVLALVGVAVLGLAVAASPVFHVREIRVEGNRRLAAEEVAGLTGVVPGSNILTLSTSEIRGSVLRDPWVGGATVRRSLPSTLLIRVRERTPVGWVRDPEGVAVVAGDGIVVGRRATEPRGLVALGRWAWPLRPGTAADIGMPLRVAASFPALLRRQVAAARFADGQVHLRLRGGVRVLYGEPDGLQAKNAALLEILGWAREGGEDLEYVDLRAPRNPAVRTRSAPDAASDQNQA